MMYFCLDLNMHWPRWFCLEIWCFAPWTFLGQKPKSAETPYSVVLENTRLMWAWKHFELVVLDCLAISSSCKVWSQRRRAGSLWPYLTMSFLRQSFFLLPWPQRFQASSFRWATLKSKIWKQPTQFERNNIWVNCWNDSSTFNIWHSAIFSTWLSAWDSKVLIQHLRSLGVTYLGLWGRRVEV